MKFENIKVGDKVYVERFVNTGYHRGKSFTIALPVEKVTKAQFMTSDGRRWTKERGIEIGGGRSFYGAKPEGEDQTQEMNEFIRHVSKVVETRNKLRSIQLPFEMEPEKVDLILKSLNEWFPEEK